MTLSWQIAQRYFRAKKRPLVSVIGKVAMLSIGISTAAMVLVLSVMNGMNRFVAERFWVIDPDLKIEAAEGKFFVPAELPRIVTEIPGVLAVSQVLKDQAILTYGDQNCMIYLQGVDSNYARVAALPAHVYSGQYSLSSHEATFSAEVLMGGGVYAQMQIPPAYAHDCRLYTVDARMLDRPLGASAAVAAYSVYPVGLFNAIPEYDNQYVFCDLDFARQAFKAQDRLSALEVRLEPGSSVKKVKQSLQERVGAGFTVKDRIDQQEAMFRSMRAEKLIVMLVFAFIMLIATFTMTADQMLLMYEKRLDMAVLSSMGMREKQIRRIFFLNGMLVNVCGTIGGLLIGSALTFGQKRFGWVKLGGGEGSYITDAYPVDWQIGDLFVVLLIGLAIGMLASALPLKQVAGFSRRRISAE